MCILYENLLLWCESHSQNFSALYYSMLAVLYSQQIIWTKLQNFSHYLSRKHYLLNKNNTCYPWATACMILCLMIISIHIAPKQLYPENELQYLETNFISLYLNQLCISQMLPPIWSAFMYFNFRLHSVGVCRISRSLNMTTKETSSINIESKLTRLKQNRIKILELLAFYSCFRKVFFLLCSCRAAPDSWRIACVQKTCALIYCVDSINDPVHCKMGVLLNLESLPSSAFLA